MIYFLPLLLIIIGIIKFDWPNTSDQGKYLWCLLYTLLVCIIGLRYKVGGDTYNYMTFFYWAPQISSWSPINYSKFEPGFSLLTSVIKTFSDDVYVYQTIISALVTFMLMYFVKKNTEYKYTAMLLIYVGMYLYFSTEVIRESIAVGGILLSYHLAEEKKYVKYLLICLVLTSIHSSASIGFFLPFIKKLQFNKNFILWIVLVVLLGGAMSKIMELLSGISVFTKLLRYNAYSYVGYWWSGFRFLYFSVLPILFLVFCKRNGICNRYESVICLQILFGFGLWFVPVTFQRLINYTIIFYFVSLANVIGICLRESNAFTSFTQPYIIVKSRIRLLLFVTLLAHSSFYFHLDFYERYYPYHSMFDPIEEPTREKFTAE